MDRHKGKVISAEVSQQAEEALRAIAWRLSEETGEAWTRSDVIRAFIQKGLDSRPVTDDELRRFRRAGEPKARRAPPRQPRLHLASGANGAGASGSESGEGGIRTRLAAA